MQEDKVSLYPQVSVIILNYNHAELTASLLASVKASCRYPHMEIIIVDNASAVDPAPTCKAVIPEIKMVYSDRNMGYAGGLNQGIRHAEGDFFMLLNNDLVFSENVIEPLLKVFAEYPDAGLVCPKILRDDDHRIIDYAGYTKINAFTGRNKGIGHGEVDNGQFDRLSATAYGHGAAMMVSRKAVDSAGLMPEQYFLYYEEIAWSERIRHHGFSIFIQPSSVVYHKVSQTTGKEGTGKTYYLARNRIWFMKENVRTWQYVIFIVYMLFIAIPYSSLRYILKGEMVQLRDYWRGCLHGILQNA